MKIERVKELLNQADAEISQGNYTEAEKLANEALSVNLSGYEELRANALCLKSESLLKRDKAYDALPISREAYSLAVESKNREVEALAIRNIGIIYSELSDYTLALEYFIKALALSEELGNALVSAKIMNNIAVAYQSLADYSHALEYYEFSISSYHKIDNLEGVADVTANMGMVYAYISDLPQSLVHFNRALTYFEDSGLQNKVAMTTGNIGGIYQMLSDYPKALEYLGRSLVAYEKLELQTGVAQTIYNIGTTYYYLNDYSRAIEYYNKALALHKKLNDKAGIARVTNGMGSVYQSLLDFQLALEYYRKSLALQEELGSKADFAKSMGNIGLIYRDLMDYEQALVYMYKGLAVNEEIGNKASAAHIIGNIGALYADKNFVGYDATKSEEYLLSAISINEELGLKQNIYLDCKVLSELYEQEGDTAKALYHFKKYHDIEKDVQSEETKKTAQRTAYERQIGEMQREQDVTERILHNILPKEIAHRIRRGDQKIVDSYNSVSVLFADIVGFTKLSQRVTAEELVVGLDGIFNTFDVLADKHGCEKIKTIGDCYMVVAGLPERCFDHAERLAAMAIEMLKAIEEFPQIVEDISVNMRIGIHSGSVVAGIIGKNKYAYDLWGDAVNTASRMESHGEPGKIHVSDEFRNALISTATNELPIRFIPRGEMDIKGKGMMKTYFLEAKQ